MSVAYSACLLGLVERIDSLTRLNRTVGGTAYGYPLMDLTLWLPCRPVEAGGL